MARREDVLVGAAIGIGLAVLVPVVVAAAMPIVRPMARSAVKAGMRAYEQGRETLEEWQDLIQPEELIVRLRYFHGPGLDVALDAMRMISSEVMPVFA